MEEWGRVGKGARQVVPEEQCLMEEVTLTRRLEISRWKRKEPSIGRRTKLARRKIEPGVIRETGKGWEGDSNGTGRAP